MSIPAAARQAIFLGWTESRATRSRKVRCWFEDYTGWWSELSMASRVLHNPGYSTSFQAMLAHQQKLSGSNHARGNHARTSDAWIWLARSPAVAFGGRRAATHITFLAEMGLGVCAEYCHCRSTKLVSSAQQTIGKQHACVLGAIACERGNSDIRA